MLRFGEIFRMKRPGVIGTWFTFSVNQQNAQGGPLLSQAQGDQPVGQSAPTRIRSYRGIVSPGEHRLAGQHRLFDDVRRQGGSARLTKCATQRFHLLNVAFISQ